MDKAITIFPVLEQSHRHYMHPHDHYLVAFNESHMAARLLIFLELSSIDVSTSRICGGSRSISSESKLSLNLQNIPQCSTDWLFHRFWRKRTQQESIEPQRWFDFSSGNREKSAGLLCGIHHLIWQWIGQFPQRGGKKTLKTEELWFYRNTDNSIDRATR